MSVLTKMVEIQVLGICKNKYCNFEKKNQIYFDNLVLPFILSISAELTKGQNAKASYTHVRLFIETVVIYISGAGIQKLNQTSL